MSLYDDFISGNIDTKDGSRSAKDWAFCRWLIRRGLDDDEIALVLCETDYNKNKFMSDSYLSRTISKCRQFIGELPVQTPIMQSTQQAGGLINYADFRVTPESDMEFISTGLPCLDVYLAGGLVKGELTLLAAHKSSGKTTFCCSVGAVALEQGQRVLAIHYEDDLNNIARRYSGLLGGKQPNTLWLADTLKEVCTLDTIEQHIRACSPDLVFVDYLNRIPGGRGGIDTRFAIRDTLLVLATFAKKYKTSLVLADHIVVSESAAKSYVMEDWELAEAKMYKSSIADNIIGFKRDRVRDNIVWITGLKVKRKNRQLKNKSLTVNWETAEFKDG